MGKIIKISEAIQTRIEGMKLGTILTPNGDTYKERTIYSWKGVEKWVNQYEVDTKKVLTSNNIAEFSTYLIRQGLSKNSIAYYTANINTMLPVGKKLKTYGEITTAVYSLEEELKLLRDLKGLSASMEILRDMYLIQSYTGLRVSDLLKLLVNIEQYLKLIEGKYYFVLKSQKTRQDVVIPLNKIVVSILKKRKFRFEKIFSTWYYSKSIKKIAKYAGFNEKVIFYRTEKGKLVEKTFEKWQLMSTHTARRSFATNAYLSGVPTLVIMRITGHSTEQSFMRYIRANSLVNALAAGNYLFFR